MVKQRLMVTTVEYNSDGICSYDKVAQNKIR